MQQCHSTERILRDRFHTVRIYQAGIGRPLHPPEPPLPRTVTGAFSLRMLIGFAPLNVFGVASIRVRSIGRGAYVFNLNLKFQISGLDTRQNVHFYIGLVNAQDNRASKQ